MRAFFFAPESARPLARVRIVLLAALFFEAAGHWPCAVELYSTAGPVLPMFLHTEIVPGADRKPDGQYPRRTVGTFHPPVPWPSTAILLATGRLFFLAAAMIGWRTRTSLVLAFGLSLLLGLLDGINFAKHSVIALHGLALLACSGCGREWSIDAFRADRDRCPLMAAWPRRLLQIALCHMYFGAALTKLRTPSFFTGDLLEFALLDDASGGGWLGQWVATHHTLVMILSLVTILFELLFPFLVWVRRARLWMVGLAGLVHLGMALFLNIGVFSPVMFAMLLAFVDERDWSGLLHRSGRSPRSSQAAVRDTLAVTPRPFGALSYVIALVVALAVGFAVQWTRDDYGVFGRHLPLPQRLPPITVDEMLWPVTPTPDHYIHHVALGSRVNGNQTFGDSHRFRVGDRVYVVVRFLQIHPEFELEGLLLSPKEGELARFTRQTGADSLVAVNGFELVPPMTPGRYLIVLQADGYEVARREIEVLP